MLSGLPVDSLNWGLGGGLCVIFLWPISVPPARERVDDAMAE
ncbi:hypothetical protein [Paraburkholderia sp. EG304]